MEAFLRSGCPPWDTANTVPSPPTIRWKAALQIAASTWSCWALQPRNKSPKCDRITSSYMKCDLCTEDHGEGIHYHAFIDGKHHWVCESCKKKLKIEAEHMDD